MLNPFFLLNKIIYITTLNVRKTICYCEALLQLAQGGCVLPIL